ncbi:hypothetical protein CLAIMM_10037 isoform 2 [Cladophialophora immunda]|nr:hypothetical protein CLAIMM_10037 isoform 2 [Cladophialophora immunda]
MFQNTKKIGGFASQLSSRRKQRCLYLPRAGRQLSAFSTFLTHPRQYDIFRVHCSHEATAELSFHLPMLISKPHSRLLSVVTILVIVALRSLCGWRVDGSLIFQFGQRSDKSSTSNKPSNSKGWIYSGPKAEDKAVILAKVRGEDVDWVFDNLQEYVT